MMISCLMSCISCGPICWLYKVIACCFFFSLIVRLNTEDNEYDARMLSFMLVQKAMFVYDDACLGDDESRLSELVRLLRDELVSEPD